MKKILITGATGNLGKAIVGFLLTKGIPASNIYALVRDEEKAKEFKTAGVNLKFADYDNYSSLLAAFKGIDKLLLISGNDVLKRDDQQLNVVNAAKEAGVEHILYTSVERKNETESSPMAVILNSHMSTENAIKASGLHYTFFRNNLYMDLLPVFLGEKVLETGVFFPAGETKAAFALRTDMAEAIANVLASEGHENKSYSISNTENVSFGEMAKIVSQVSGKNIGYANPDAATYIDALTKAGVPAEVAGMFAGFGEAIKQGELATTNKDLENLLGRKPVTAAEFLKQVYAS